MKKLLLIMALFVLACNKRDANASLYDKLKQDPDLKNYVSKLWEYNHSFLNNDWGLSNPQVHQKYINAKANRNVAEVTKTMKNHSGKTLFQAHNELFATFFKVQYKYVIKQKMNQELFKKAMLEEYTKKDSHFDYRGINFK